MPSRRWALDPTSQRVALTVLRHGPISRADLGRRVQLSSASVTRLTKPMVAAGLLVEGEPLGRTTGRPALPLDIAADSATFVGLMISHDGLQAALTDLRGTILATASCAVEGLTPTAMAITVRSLVDELCDGRHSPVALGVALGATVGPDGLITGATFFGWPGPLDLAALLEHETGHPTTIDNDVNAFTVAEHWFGVGRDVEELAVLTIGTGVGLGLVCRDDLVRGHSGAVGMIGPLHVLGGQRAEHVLNRAVIESRVMGVLGRVAPWEELPSLALTSPPLAALLDEVAEAVGELAGTVTAIINPERILVAGDAAPLLSGRESQVRDVVDRMHPAHVPMPDVVVAVVGQDEWARGAAALAIRAYMGADHG